MRANNFNILIIGAHNVGKTSLISSYSSNIYPFAHDPVDNEITAVRKIYRENVKDKTIDKNELNCNEAIVDMSIIDCSDLTTNFNGQLTSKLDACFVCFDISVETTLRPVVIPAFMVRNRFKNIPIILVGLKGDQTKRINKKTFKRLKNNMDFKKYIECNCENNNSVKYLFDKCIKYCMNNARTDEQTK
ncbi:hypothetical protein QTN25_000997 [Entamoeba marina]